MPSQVSTKTSEPPRRQHVVVSASKAPISSDRIPSTGPVAVLPLDTTLASSLLGHLKRSLTEIKSAKVQYGVDAITKETAGIIWLDNSPAQFDLLKEILSKYANIGWVQLPMAGINAYSSLVDSYPDKVWTSAKGAFSQPVAEHALTLSLALLRYLPMRVRATEWGPSRGLSLFNSNIVIIGAGGITTSLLSLLEAFTPSITVLRRTAEPLEADIVPPKLRDHIRVDTLANLDSHLVRADIVIAACALTPQTHSCLGAKQFALMQDHAIIVNVARGEVIKIDDLVVALQEGQIGGAGLDVTAPEPLPRGHPLWSLETTHANAKGQEDGMSRKRANLIITPHTADTIEQIVPLLTQRACQNVGALLAGDGTFQGVVDPDAGY